MRCNAKLFADGTSLFSTINSPVISSSNLNENLRKTAQSTYQWKLSFNPDIIKEAQEIIFSRKKKDTNHPDLYFNEARLQRRSVQKHLRLFLDEKLSFLKHIENYPKKNRYQSFSVLSNIA